MTGRAYINSLAPTRGGPRARALIAATLMLPLLCACATVQPMTVSTQDSAAAFKGRTLDDPGLKVFAARADITWPPALLDAPALDIAALYYNPSLAAARVKWQVAQAAVTTAGEIPNPTLSLSPQYAANALPGVSPWVVAASLVQIIETAGKRDFRIARARYLAEAARLDALNTAWDTITAVNGALTDIGAQERRLTALEPLIAAQSTLADIAETRLRAGLGASLEVSAARTALNRSLVDRETAQTALTDAQHLLAQAVGVPVESLKLEDIAATLPLKAPSAEFRKTIREDAILNRADLLARLANYGAADAALQLEVGRQYPDIELGPGYEYDQGDRKWGLSVALAVPVFNQNKGAIGEAVAARRQAADEFTSVQARVIGDVDRALASYDSAVRSDAVADELVRRQDEHLRDTQELLRRGQIDRVELLAAQIERATAELAKADADGALAKAQAGVESASQRTQRGFDPAPLVTTPGRP